MRRMADTTEVPWGGKVSPATISDTTIRAQESKKISREKTRVIIAELCAMKLKKAAKKVEDAMEETLTYCAFPSECWTRIRTNNLNECLNRETRRRTRVVGTFPDATPP